MKAHQLKETTCCYNENLENTFLNYLNEYVNQSTIDPKAKKFIKDRNFIKENPSYYLYYPLLFVDAFNSNTSIKHLTIAGFLYYKSVIYMDEIFDKNTPTLHDFLQINCCQEECIKLLSQLFKNDSEFWELWNKRKNEYLKAYNIDIYYQNVNSFNKYIQLADLKSSIGKIAIDALFILSEKKNKQLYNDLLKSHKYFYCGFQILDDIHDFQEDLKNKQYNLAYSELKEKLKNRNKRIEDFNINDLNKYIYILGIAEKLLDKSMNMLDKAEQTISRYNLPLWKTEIRKLFNTSLSHQLNIKAYITHISIKSSLSYKKNNINNDPKKSIKNSIQFLTSYQDNEGCWKEFYNDAGLSDYWATAFITSFLAQDDVKSYIKEDLLQKSLNFINKNDSNLWGYNKSWIPDADSTNFAFIANYLIKKNIQNVTLNKWLKFQNKDGGFSTFNNTNKLISSLNEKHIKETTGWTKSHPCVSVVAFYLLSLLKIKDSQFYKLRGYLIDQQDVNGFIKAYWWTSPIYTTCYFIKSVFINNEDQKLAEIIQKTLINLMNNQNENGSFGEGFIKESPFYTGLIVDTICSKKEVFKIFKKQIEKSIYWLINNQHTDGSWSASNSLRIPAPHIINPDKITEWPIQTRGTNIRPREYNRLFTTAVILSGLIKYNLHG